MIRRKDSMSFAEFMRGKYDPTNIDYVSVLIKNMTLKEQAGIASDSFETLWKQLWGDDRTSADFAPSRDRFNQLDRVKLMRDNLSEYVEPEWGFPKGRRNINEDDMNCAVREFQEETGIHTRNIRINWDIKPLEEVFTGSNKVRYKHVYYVAKYIPSKFETEDDAIHQNKEVKDVQWFNYQDAQDKIRGCNVERKELFKRLNQIIIKSYHYGM
jgi:8-oxo-dGTP pyrophosphatase MutT (NUDIX family)